MGLYTTIAFIAPNIENKKEQANAIIQGNWEHCKGATHMLPHE